ncbi:MAG: NAD(P)/FAD-dependent oxidoreductase [Steroidobacteraceae bacterium]
MIGAGAAGLAAARTLGAEGVRVTIFEARSHAGGRASTDRSLGCPADLGAAWLHFAHDNPFSGIARKAGFTIDEREPDWGPRGRIAGKRPTEQEALGWDAATKRYYAAIARAAEAGRDVPLTAVLPQDEFRTRFDAVMTWAVGADSSEISTVDLENYADGGPNWAVREGLGTVVAHEATSLGELVTFRYDARVTQVDWSGAGVIVRTESGEWRGDAVIITIPTAALARDTVRFAPPLPATHRDAIEALPLGVVNKVFFRIDDALMPEEPLFTVGSATTTRTAHYQLRPAGQPLALAFFGGEFSRELERRGELEAFAREELASIFGREFIAGIRGTLATAWHADPFAGGSYSVARPGQASQRHVLAEPVSPRLLFAGEACSKTHYGTLVGAWESGVAAARRLL